MRIERDNLGEIQLKDNVYYGNQTYRALQNFTISNQKLNSTFIKSFAVVKLACAQINTELRYLSKEKGNAIQQAAEEIVKGKFHEQIVVDPFQGGAGTSTNMNFNEVIANRALEILEREKADYKYIHPLKHVNLHQSTNDVYPTALKVAVLLLLKETEEVTAELQEEFQKKEFEFKDVVKLGRTQLQDAVPMTLGMTFGAFAEAISRDRWRIFKSRERIKVVNLGGTAIGTGLNAPREFIFKAAERVRQLTGLALSRSENMIDTTQNLDCFVEVSGMLKAYAANLLKISNDLRLLASGPQGGIGEIKLPKVQKGSTIMPGKVNPVIPEMIGQVALKVMNNDSIVAQTAGMGNLELNQFIPLLGYSILESLELLKNSIPIFSQKCIKTIKANKARARDFVFQSKTLGTILINKFGYEKIENFLIEADKKEITIYELLIEKEIFTKEEMKEVLSPQNMYKMGF